MVRGNSVSGLVATARDWSSFIALMITWLVPPLAGYPHLWPDAGCGDIEGTADFYVPRRTARGTVRTLNNRATYRAPFIHLWGICKILAFSLCGAALTAASSEVMASIAAS